MTKPRSGTRSEKKSAGTVQRLLHGRALGPLLGPWIGCFIAFALVFLLEYELPAFHEFVKVIYFVIAVVFIIATGRYFRPRERGNRRHGDRRRQDRRQDERTAK